MPGPLGTGLTLQQLLALGLVVAFVGAVRVLDFFHNSVGTGLERTEPGPGNLARPEGFAASTYGFDPDTFTFETT